MNGEPRSLEAFWTACVYDLDAQSEIMRGAHLLLADAGFATWTDDAQAVLELILRTADRTSSLVEAYDVEFATHFAAPPSDADPQGRVSLSRFWELFVFHLRASLVLVVGAADMLRTDGDALPPEDRAELAALAAQSVDRFANTVEAYDVAFDESMRGDAT